jgi:hypothetical protein
MARIATMPCGGAERDRWDSLLMNEATKVAGR